MNRWVFPAALIALVSNLVALLLAFLGGLLISFVLGLAVLLDLMVVILLVSRSRTLLPKTAQSPGEIPSSITSTNLISPGANGEPLPVNSNQTPSERLITPATELLAFSTPAYLAPELEIGDKDVRAEQDSSNAAGKEDLLDNFRWLGLVEECIELEDELADLCQHLDEASLRIADHTIIRIQEILVRSDVEMITDERVFNQARHKAEPLRHPPPGTPITVTLRPGFAVGRRVLRRAQVRVDRVSQSGK